MMVTSRTWGRVSAWATSLAVIAAGVALLPASAAHADHHVLPGNESDIGVYTDGQADTMDIGDPTYSNLGTVEQDLEPGVPWTADSMHQSIFDKDLAAGGTDYYLDRILGVRGNLGNAVLQTRGRSLYMRGASNNNFTQLGFAGSAFVGGPNNLGNLFTVQVRQADATVPLAEVPAERFNAPSHAKSQLNVGTTGVVVNQRKFMTYDNVAVSAMEFSNPGAAPVTFTLRAASGLATQPGATADELSGTRTITSGANNGLVDTPWVQMKFGLKGAGFSRNGTNLEREVTIPAGGSSAVSVAAVAYHDQLRQSYDSFEDYAALSPNDAFRTAVTAFNRRWAEDIPYVNVPDPAVEKAIVYRWWGERYNSLDAAAPGYVYQYPTTIEGVNLYQNAVALTQPMHLQDTKWIRNPYLGYGQVMNIGELSGSSAFIDSPGHTSWNNHYSQYLGTAGLEAFNVHGGGPAVAERFAEYFEGDGVGQLEHYDGNDDNLIAYDTNYMPGNDSDAITFGFPKANASAPGARTIERPESAYVWGAFDAASQLYEMAGDDADAGSTSQKADEIQAAILDRLWSPDMRMFTALTSHGAQSAATANGNPNPLPADQRDHIPSRESNLYDVYAENLIPEGDAAEYVDGFRFLRYGDNFPIFPFYTANQFDKTRYNIGGSNNFSNINFTVQYRAVRSALRHYDPEGKYVTPEYARRLLDWMAWSIYPQAGDVRQPNQAEYYSNWNPTAKTYNRNNQNHVMLGNMNYIYVEDMGGIQPRSDDKIELWPIDLGYEHFMVNNLRYHGKDVTIVWDEDGSAYGMGAGYSLFIDGEKKANATELGRFTYDPATNTVDGEDGLTVTATDDTGADVPTAVDTEIEDERVVDYMKTAGIDLTEDATNLASSATLSSSYTQAGTRPTPWRTFHTPGITGQMNYTPGAIATTERPVSLDAVNDGNTVSEPYWGNYGTTTSKGYIELDLGSAKTFDNVKVFFYSDRQTGGYREPARYFVQVPDGSGGWKAVPNQWKSMAIPQAKFNEALFDTVTSDKVRVAFDNAPGNFTAISEIQVFDSGREVPDVAGNAAPVVTVNRDAAGNGNLRTRLVATASDDGLPYDQDLTFGWEVVSKPAGAGAIISSPSSLTTTVTGTIPGDYVFRFRASDGELTTEREITVNLEEVDTFADLGQYATITTSGFPSWENPQQVKNPSTPASSNPGAGNGWGTYGQANNGGSEATAAWIRYAWDEPVRLAGSDIYWYDDNGGTRRPNPATYAIERSDDGTTWTPVTLQGSAYADALLTNRYNRLNFEPITTKFLRIRIFGIQNNAAGTGVLRWRAYSERVESTEAPVIVRTEQGVVPELPTQLNAVYESGARTTIPFTWQEITPAMVEDVNTDPFVVYGTNSDYGLIAEAQVYVRPETPDDGITIQGAQQFEQTVAVGEQPYLPTKLLVSYNDGSRDNQAVGIEWDYDETLVDTPGTYFITGNLVLPDYVGDAGTTTTTLKLTVGEGDTAAPVTTLTWTPAEPDGNDGWYKTAPTFTLTPEDTGGSGVVGSDIQYRIDDGAWQAYGVGPVTVPDGTHTIEYRSTDRAGNAETAKSAGPVKVDATAPVSSATVQDATVTVTATDALSGVDLIEVKVDDGEWTEYTAPVTVEGEGTHTVLYRATDVAGVVEADRSVEVTVPPVEQPDTTGPQIGLAGVTSRSYLDAARLTLRWNATDSESGVASTTATLDGKPVRQGELNLHTMRLGQHTLAVTSVDRAGNTSSRTVRFTTITSITSMRTLITRFIRLNNASTPALTRELRTHLDNAAYTMNRGRNALAIGHLQKFKAATKRLRYKSHGEVLRRDANWMIVRLR